MTHRGNSRGWWPRAVASERRVQTSIFLPKLTIADGEWLARTLPGLQRNARPEPQSVRVEDVSLRYRTGRLGIADALDATAALLEPFAAAGAVLAASVVNEDAAHGLRGGGEEVAATVPPLGWLHVH